MNDLNNISEYQKIIFANGLDESTIDYTGGIEALSKKYPFVFFITNQSNKSGIESGDRYEIDNIWFEGKRLTRFIGIDQSHNALTVGGHTLSLKFDPQTGLIGLYDNNELESLSIEAISCGGNTYLMSSNDQNNYTISSYDNKFSIIFKYVLKDTDNNNVNIRNINKALSYIPIDYFDKIGEDDEKIISNTQQTYKFTYKIKKPYNTSSKDILFISNYANDKSCSVPLKLYLHPESYDITLTDLDNYVINNVTNNSNELTYNLCESRTYILLLKFNPLVDSNQDYHQIWAELERTEDKNSEGEYSFIITKEAEIKNGEAKFSLITSDKPNNISNSNLTIKVKFKTFDDNKWIYYPNDLEKKLKINVGIVISGGDKIEGNLLTLQSSINVNWYLESVSTDDKSPDALNPIGYITIKHNQDKNNSVNVIVNENYRSEQLWHKGTIKVQFVSQLGPGPEIGSSEVYLIDESGLSLYASFIPPIDSITWSAMIKAVATNNNEITTTHEVSKIFTGNPWTELLDFNWKIETNINNSTKFNIESDETIDNNAKIKITPIGSEPCTATLTCTNYSAAETYILYLNYSGSTTTKLNYYFDKYNNFQPLYESDNLTYKETTSVPTEFDISDTGMYVFIYPKQWGTPNMTYYIPGGSGYPPRPINISSDTYNFDIHDFDENKNIAVFEITISDGHLEINWE